MPSESSSRLADLAGTKVRLVSEATAAHPSGMKKRIVASFLWFLVGWQAGGVLVGLMAMPAVLGFVPGIAMAVFVLWDPTHRMSTRPAQARTFTPINDYAAALDRQTDKWVENWPVVEAGTKRG